MTEICCGMMSENDASAPREPTSRAARRRRMEIRRLKFVSGLPLPEPEDSQQKRKKQEASLSRECDNAVANNASEEEEVLVKTENRKSSSSKISVLGVSLLPTVSSSSRVDDPEFNPRYGVASVCGRRRDMEDLVAIHPSLCRADRETGTEYHYFGVYDGHGCSHVAARCKERLHELVKEEVETKGHMSPKEWESAMELSFRRMDKEAVAGDSNVVGANCRCELQTPMCDAVGSTAVVSIVTPEKIIVANCGDSRAVLCRNGKPVPLSSDHKPDRPDELDRIQAAGGRVIYWDGARVLGVLAMSRAIGDNYLKPYVSCEPEVTMTDRKAEDDCLILASDGLWDVVSNEMACGVVSMCLRAKNCASPCSASGSGDSGEVVVDGKVSDKACADASMLLTKLALARHSTDNVSVVVVDLRRDRRLGS
ncbi:Highly ABA-induced PP2C2 isoform 1 [Tripterygium wilfordii]|uniref:protein-serine/threonine phosphatase n=1 Tax=Tripterygium wilfordii TaxID=458696 RepID=A0A7J7DYT5_TRIWF|nr:probable protein phosphatase 2C 24 [Tripterygium wilfordii]KAF5751421.1 Highly ABA-induced PP2C2 isoform 1 [Tripterygium wilfordii]